MASASLARRFISTTLLLCIGLFRAALLGIFIGAQVLFKGRRVLQPKERSEEPECLRDPELGSHEFVTLERTDLWLRLSRKVIPQHWLLMSLRPAPLPSLSILRMEKIQVRAVAKDVTLHYVSAGSRDKPLVLLLHGFPDFWFSWKYQILDLKKDFWVVVPDLRGYGQSSKPASVDDYQVSKLVEDVHGLVKSLGRQKVTVIGHDWGAPIAWSFATKHEDMVKKLIIINGPHPVAMQRQLHNSLEQIFKSWYIVAFQLPCVAEAFLSVNDMQALDELHAVYSDEEREAFKYTFGKPGALTGPINYYRASFQRLSSGGFKFRRLAVPVLIVWGRRDTALTEGVAVLNLDYATGGRVEYMSDAGHWVQRERPGYWTAKPSLAAR
ncbi:hypothetical protein HPB52_013003 [Rhipicephalus sanguineus]|uniref:AB hydrolase-1 domain-containing protein n=1 Tax=Rhipicephalus sanguineus TaxID=34632 RepID=A0A9D4QAM8_RHISA|nr:hypothetical protein HPB52_013003 [Rhipicephalus sanguineus]